MQKYELVFYLQKNLSDFYLEKEEKLNKKGPGNPGPCILTVILVFCLTLNPSNYFLSNAIWRRIVVRKLHG